MDENEKIEINLLLQAIYEKYGYDFRDYAKASIRRRIHHRLQLSRLETITRMIHEVLQNREFFEKLLLDLTINVTEMFRDPSFFKAVRQIIAPALKKDDFIKIWHAGCSTGEEVYSMAILLREEGLVNNFRIYATDANEVVLAKAKKGIYPLDKMKAYTRNYRNAGGLTSFADYYTARYDHVIIDNKLKKNILFSHHNLVTDFVFGEMDLVVCRNVLIYFSRELQDRAFQLFSQSLHTGGYLCLGSKETTCFSKYADLFEKIERDEKIYIKK
ncbi:MAG: protein-glutamate O-methyltransferase CheR [bacterium]|nr:protein-glutamate O-methyltransferase CheR [bacterium]